MFGNAVDSYKQGSWISKLITEESQLGDFVMFMHDLVERALNNFELIKNVKIQIKENRTQISQIKLFRLNLKKFTRNY